MINRRLYILIMIIVGLIFTGCNLDNNTDTQNSGSNDSEGIEASDSLNDNTQNSDEDKDSDNTGTEEGAKQGIKPNVIGDAEELNYDEYQFLDILTEDWADYHTVSSILEKKLMEMDGSINEDSALVFSYGDKILVLASDKDNFSIMYMAVLFKSNGEYKIESCAGYEYSFNSAKEEVLVKGDDIVVMTQFPFSAYTLYGKFKYSEGNIEYMSLVDFDSSIEYYNEFMEMLNEGDLDGAIALENYSSYPFSYEELYFKSGNLSLRKSFEFAEVAYKNGDYERAKYLLEWGMGEYFSKHYNYMPDFENLTFENVYIKNDRDFGYNYVLDNNEIINYVEYYADVVDKMGMKDKYDKVINSLEILKAKLEGN